LSQQLKNYIKDLGSEDFLLCKSSHIQIPTGIKSLVELYEHLQSYVNNQGCLVKILPPNFCPIC